MTVVFVSSEKGDEDIFPLFSLLERCKKTSVITKNFTTITDADIMLLPLSGEAATAGCNCAAVLFSASDSVKQLPDNCTVLCFDEQGAACCRGNSRQIISCGMHHKDTVTLSSMESGKPVLSVQRQLTAFSGDIIEVGDHPLITSEQNHRALIAACTLLLLCGKQLESDCFL